MTIQVITNNQHRPVIDAWELTPREREEFDYLNWKAIEAGNDSASFFRYRGQLYDLSEFVENSPVPGWDAFASDSYFSGIVVRYTQGDDGNSVVVGTLIA